MRETVNWRAEWPVVGILGLLPLLGGCKTTPLDNARNKFYAGKFEEADGILARTEPKERNRLLHLEERGLILHTAGKYRESSEVLLQAAQLAEDLEIISASRSLTSTVTTERVKSYRGEAFERVLIHTYLMLDFLLLQDYDNALVEGKRALKRLADAKEPLEQHPFVRYVAALCFEILHEHQDAYIEYRHVQEFLPQYQEVKWDLIRMAQALGRKEEEEQWRQLPGPVADEQAKSSLVVLVQTGKAPKKVSKEIFIPPSHRFTRPVYVTRHSRVEETLVKLGDREAGRPRVLLNINAVAAHDLDKRVTKTTVKEIVRKGAQEVLAQQVDNIFGQIALRAAFFGMARADDRSWQTLPRDIRLVRIPVQPGTYNVSVLTMDANGSEVDRRDFEGVVVPADRPAILNVRSIR